MAGKIDKQGRKEFTVNFLASNGAGRVKQFLVNSEEKPNLIYSGTKIPFKCQIEDCPKVIQWMVSAPFQEHSIGLCFSHGEELTDARIKTEKRSG